jgi:hypothetical protein
MSRSGPDIHLHLPIFDERDGYESHGYEARNMNDPTGSVGQEFTEPGPTFEMLLLRLVLCFSRLLPPSNTRIEGHPSPHSLLLSSLMQGKELVGELGESDISGWLDVGEIRRRVRLSEEASLKALHKVPGLPYNTGTGAPRSES